MSGFEIKTKTLFVIFKFYDWKRRNMQIWAKAVISEVSLAKLLVTGQSSEIYCDMIIDQSRSDQLEQRSRILIRVRPIGQLRGERVGRL